VKLWYYQGLKHDCWTRAYNEPDLPRWLLAHHGGPKPDLSTFAERLTIPFHPPAIKLPPAVLDGLTGDYRDLHGRPAVSVFRQGDQLYEKNLQGEVAELDAVSPSTFFYPNGSSTTRLYFERDAQGRVVALVLHDDRHQERWEKRNSASSH
jgi:hypothetical protein